MPTHLEGSGIRNADGQIGENGEQLVGRYSSECQVVGYLVNCEEQILVGRSADGICESDELPAERTRVAEGYSDRKLERDDGEHNPFRERFVAHEFGDFRVCGHNCLSTRTMGLFGHDPEEVGGVLRRRCVFSRVVAIVGHVRPARCAVESFCAAVQRVVGHKRQNDGPD